MPELPEVHTTATILNRLVKGRVIKSVWTDYNSPYYYGKNNIKDPKYFRKFSAMIKNKKIIRVKRRAKNILIDIEGDKTILIHMKMTGQLLYGKYKQSNGGEYGWQPVDEKSPLKNPFSRFIHLIIVLDDQNHIAFSDMRKFGTIKLLVGEKAYSAEFRKMGPEPLDQKFNFEAFRKQISSKPGGHVKTVLMNPEVISGIGNIYSDEILFASKIMPTRKTSSLSRPDLRLIFKQTKRILKMGIELGGDSMSDYRNPYGEKGGFQLHHKVYGRKKKKCFRRGCNGTISRVVINGRSAHFCPVCQK